MRALLLLLLLTPAPGGAELVPTSCGSHWCMRLLGVGGSGYACMVGGEMAPTTCQATTGGCTRSVCRSSVVAGPGGGVIAILPSRCGFRQSEPVRRPAAAPASRPSGTSAAGWAGL